MHRRCKRKSLVIDLSLRYGSQLNVTQELPRKNISTPVSSSVSGRPWISPIRAFIAPRKSRTRKRSRPGNPLNYKSYSRAVPQRRSSLDQKKTKLPGKENFVSTGREKRRTNSRGQTFALSLCTLPLSRWCQIKSRPIRIARHYPQRGNNRRVTRC